MASVQSSNQLYQEFGACTKKLKFYSAGVIPTDLNDYTAFQWNCSGRSKDFSNRDCNLALSSYRC